MARLPVPDGDRGQWGTVLNDFLSVAHQQNGYLQDGIVTIDAIAQSTVVDLISDQTIGGVKTFSESPIVPTPTTDYQAATKAYVDSNSQVVAGNTTGADPGTAVAIDAVNGSSGNTIASADGAIAIGYDGTYAASATGQDSIAIGAGSSASQESTIAIGWDASAAQEGDVAIGGALYSESGTEAAFADGPGALALGTANATGQQSIAIGNSATANGEFTVAIGFSNIAQSYEYAGAPTTAIGSDNQVNSQSSVAVGQSNYIDDSSYNAAALGVGSSVYNSNGSLAINGTVTNAYNSLAVYASVNGGGGNISGAVAIGADADGGQASATNQNQFVLGTSNHNVDVPGTLEVDGSLMVPTSAPASPQDGQIWIASDGLYFQTNGNTYGPFINP